MKSRRWRKSRLNHSRSNPDVSHDELTSVVEHSERESHLALPLDALQWTIFGGVTIQHQNRQIKITRSPPTIDETHAPTLPSQLSHQTLRGFGSTRISGRAIAREKIATLQRQEGSRMRSVQRDDDHARAMETNTHTLRVSQRLDLPNMHAPRRTSIASSRVFRAIDVNDRRVGELVGRLVRATSCRSAGPSTTRTIGLNQRNICSSAGSSAKHYGSRIGSSPRSCPLGHARPRRAFERNTRVCARQRRKLERRVGSREPMDATLLVGDANETVEA